MAYIGMVVASKLNGFSIAKIKEHLVSSSGLKSFASNSLWSVLGAFFSKGLNFISISLIAKLLGPEIFGEYNVVQTTIGLFGSVSGLGLGLAATKLIAEWKRKDNTKTGDIIGTFYAMSLMISWAVFLIFFLSSGWVAESFFNNSSLKIYFQITAFIVVFDSLNGVQNGIMTGFESFKKMTIINMVIGILSAPILLLGAYLNGLLGVTIALLFTRFINVFIYRFILQKEFLNFNIKSKIVFNKEVVKSILGISIPSFLSGLTTSPVNWFATSLFVHQPGGYQSLGVYNAANQLRTLVLFLPDSAGRVAMPMMASAYGHGDLKKFKSTVLITFLSNLVMSIIPALFILLFGGLFQQFLGVQYQLTTELIVVVLATGVLIALTNAVGYVFICSNWVWCDFYLRIVWGITLVLLISFYGRFNGALGYSLSFTGAYMIYFLIQLIVTMKILYFNRI